MHKLKNKEAVISNETVFISITDTNGNIEYCSDDFVELTGFDIVTLIGSQHRLLRHNDMPSSLYKYIWGRLEKEEEVTAIIKNKDANDDYFWMIADFVIRKDNEMKVIGYRANRRPASEIAIDTIDAFYKKLVYLENFTDIDLAMGFFNEYFEIRKTNYDDFINKLTSQNNPNSANINNASSKNKKFSSVRNFLTRK